MDAALAVSLGAVVVMAAAIVYVGQLDFLSKHPRNWWLSLCSGATAGYGFLALLPKLYESQKDLGSKLEDKLGPFEHHLFLVALVGMLVYYGLVLASYASHRKHREHEGKDTGSPGLLWANVGLFSLYVFLLGEFMEHSADDGIGAVLVPGVVLTLHFASTDFGLREHFRDRWVGKARWVIAAAVIAGWLVGWLLHPSKELVGIGSAFMAGAILVNVLSDELPEERDARFLPFAGGAVASALLFASIG